MGYRGLSIVGTAIIGGFLALLGDLSNGRDTTVVYQGHHPRYGDTRLVINSPPTRVTVKTPDLYFTFLDINGDRRYDTATIHRGEGFSRGHLERGVSTIADGEIERLEEVVRETVAAARRGEMHRVGVNDP